MISEQARVEMAETMRLFPEVVWDRFVGDDEDAAAYGWIERDDDRSDFLLLRFLDGGTRVGFTTSSARYSEEFMERLTGTSEGHIDCERVEEWFAGLLADEAMVRL